MARSRVRRKTSTGRYLPTVWNVTPTASATVVWGAEAALAR
ncbi:MAG: hypothetical protein ABI601_15805 [bacterium]